jgi:signal transduction histidine kinase
MLTALVLITVAGAAVMIWYTYRMEGLLTEIIDQKVEALEAAGALEISLVNQKGFVSYFFIDGNPKWLEQLKRYRLIFRDRLEKAKTLTDGTDESKTLSLIESQYKQYVSSIDRVIEHYRYGSRETGYQLHEKVRGYFFNIFELCDEYKGLYREKVQDIKKKSRNQASRLRFVAATALLFAVMLTFILIFFLIHDILEPIRRLALETARDDESPKSIDEVKALKRGVDTLMNQYDHAQFELVKSRSHLIEAEKMALVGKLAAGTAHSIRNPLTSVKMRLFSLSQSINLKGPQKEDVEVISEEIGHIDSIVQNFLEFSRPPRLRLEHVSPSDIVDLAIRLLRQRLESCGVNVVIKRTNRLPATQLDPEQLKEALVNIVVNGCEAMSRGGSILIKEEEREVTPEGRVLIIRVSDDGPGIANSLQQKVFEPFFTTKEEGTGLGLSIVSRIIQEHGGWVDLESKEGEGTSFIIILPFKEPTGEHRLNH